MSDLIAKLNRRLAEICGFSLVVMVIFLVADLMARSLGSPLQGGGIIAMFVMVTAVYFGLAACEERRKHIRVTALEQILPDRIRAIVQVAVQFVLVVMFAIVAFAVAENAVVAFESGESVPAGTRLFQVWPVKFGIVIGVGLYWLQLLANLWEDIARVWKLPDNDGEND